MAVLLLAGMLILVGGAITIAAAKDAKEKNTMKSRQYYDKEKQGTWRKHQTIMKKRLSRKMNAI